MKFVHSEACINENTYTSYDIHCEPAGDKLGVMIVGVGGNNGSTLRAALLANKNDITWRTKNGIQKPNFLGSLALSGSAAIGANTYRPVKDIADLVDVNDIVVGGWDISSAPLNVAMRRAGVLHENLQTALATADSTIPLRSLYYPRFIASNQKERADNTLPGSVACTAHLDAIRHDIRDFRKVYQLDRLVVMWAANTERNTKYGFIHENSNLLLEEIGRGQHEEISPSMMFAVAAIQENCLFINTSPQNTLCPAVLQLAHKYGTMVAGSDALTGQTKLKSVLADLFVSSGFKMRSVTSYNHLGNNDGRNLNEEQQFKSKEISKTGLLDKIIATNPAVTYETPPDHTVVIKYVPAVNDNKKALDEFVANVFMDSEFTLVTSATCPDSMLAVPILLDMIIIGDWLTRLRHADGRRVGGAIADSLGMFFKAPVGGSHASYFVQREALLNLMRGVGGIPLWTPLSKL